MPDEPQEEEPRARKGHRFWASLLMVIGLILTPITIVALFANTEISDTDRYVQNVAPLATNPAIQTFVADEISGALLEKLDEKRYIANLLPERAQPLVEPMRRAFDGFVQSTTLKVVQSEQFEKIWEQANRTAHTQIQYVLTGQGGDVIKSSNGKVSVDVTALVNKVIVQLKNSGIDVFSRIPIVTISRQIPIFESQDLYKARKAVGLLNKVAFILPFLVFGCFGLAVFLSKNRRRAFLWAAICFAIGAALLAVALALGRNLYLDAVSGQDIPHDAAAAVYDTLVRFLHTSVRAALFFSIIVAFAVFFSGPSRLGVGFRNRVHASVDWLGHESDEAGWTWLGPLGPVVRHKGALRIAIAAVLFVVLFRWPRPTPMVIFWVGVVALVLLALVEYFGREPVAAA